MINNPGSASTLLLGSVGDAALILFVHGALTALDFNLTAVASCLLFCIKSFLFIYFGLKKVVLLVTGPVHSHMIS